MSPPNPSSATKEEIQKLRKSLVIMERLMKNYGSVDFNGDGYAMVRYIRLLEAEYKAMKEAIKEVQSWGHSEDCIPNDDSDGNENFEECVCCYDIFSKLLSSLTLCPAIPHPLRVRSQLYPLPSYEYEQSI
jgi:hypothetical protein